MKSLTTALLLVTNFYVQSQNIEFVEVLPGQTVEVIGNLDQGEMMATLNWAWDSSVACFPETQAAKFTGSHVLYVVNLPANSEMKVVLIPMDDTANFSLYAYQIGQLSNSTLVPKLSSCIRCEADYKWDYKYKGKIQDHSRIVKNLLALRNPYQVVIGIAGANGLDKGEYALHITLKKR